MDTPIYGFWSPTAPPAPPGPYARAQGRCLSGLWVLDITEISGADSLYEADGIIAQSEQNAMALFGSGKTVYSTEGSSQCIRAMLYLALTHRRAGTPPVVVAQGMSTRHSSTPPHCWIFKWSGCGRKEGAPPSAAAPSPPSPWSRPFAALEAPPAAVYITSPDYLGGMADVEALARVCHRHGTMLAVDNAHGAYLHFLPQPRHPLDLGADLCCDSAHKTLPVLTGGAYLHLSTRICGEMAADVAKSAMALFGSTSPSYLTLASLNRCNRYLAQDYPARLADCIRRLEGVRQTLRDTGWQVLASDPLRITIQAPQGQTGISLGQRSASRGRGVRIR